MSGKTGLETLVEGARETQKQQEESITKAFQHQSYGPTLALFATVKLKVDIKHFFVWYDS